MTSPFKIVKTTEEDLPEIINLWRLYFTELKELRMKEGKGVFECRTDVLESDFSRSTEEHIRNRDSLVILISKDGENVGFSVSTIIKHEWARESCGFIEAIYVLPEFRGQGAGRDLKNTIERWLQLHVITAVELGVAVILPESEKIWKQWGYEPIKVCMRKSLPRLK